MLCTLPLESELPLCQAIAIFCGLAVCRAKSIQGRSACLGAHHCDLPNTLGCGQILQCESDTRILSFATVDLPPFCNYCKLCLCCLQVVPPPQQHGNIIGYKVQWRSLSDAEEFEVEVNSQTAYTLESLYETQDYVVTVVAKTKHGYNDSLQPQPIIVSAAHNGEQWEILTQCGGVTLPCRESGMCIMCVPCKGSFAHPRPTLNGARKAFPSQQPNYGTLYCLRMKLDLLALLESSLEFQQRAWKRKSRHSQLCQVTLDGTTPPTEHEHDWARFRGQWVWAWLG